MRSVINGKRYNTETATLLASWDNGAYAGDSHACSERLYRTKKGALFIAGEGGALSSYSQSASCGGSCGGAAIRTLGRTQALEWLESHDLTGEIDKYFAELVIDA